MSGKSKWPWIILMFSPRDKLILLFRNTLKYGHGFYQKKNRYVFRIERISEYSNFDKDHYPLRNILILIVDFQTMFVVCYLHL